MRTFTRLLVAATFLLMIAGGLVTSTGSGLAVPDWPLSYGRLLPPMVGGIRFEHTHRMIAATVGLLTLLLTLWIGRREPRRWVRRLAIIALGTVVLQGILGGITVLWRLPIPISVAHAVLGQTFFVLVVLLATIYSADRVPVSGATPRPLRAMAAFTTAAIYTQLILGAALRHAGWRPALVLAHAGGAFAVAVCILRMAWLCAAHPFDDPRIVRRARWLAWLLLAQFGLGLITLMGRRPVWAATAHVAVGALLLAHAAVLTWHLRPPWSWSLVAGRRQIQAYLELTKPRLTLLAAVTTWAGYYLSGPRPFSLGRLVVTVVGAFLVGGGANALNQYLEGPADARMPRTARRPIPSARLTPRAARRFGLLIAGVGVLSLAAVHPLSAALGLFTLVSYLGGYTPLKTRTTLCTLVGAIPGAMPPLIGWAAARGHLGPGAWALFALLFLWQLPHFLALAWLHREEYAQAGFRMLPVIDPTGAVVGRQIALYCLALLPASLAPTVFGMAGGLYFFAAIALGLAFLGVGVCAAVAPTPAAARRLFLASILYLPAILAVMAFNKVA